MWQVVASSDPRMETEPVSKERNAVRAALRKSSLRENEHPAPTYHPQGWSLRIPAAGRRGDLWAPRREQADSSEVLPFPKDKR